MRRHKKKRVQEEITLNLTAMLDMAFQLLAFFILTFKPPPAEGQIILRLPPPESTNIKGLIKKGDDQKVDNPDTLKGVETLIVTVFANEGRGPAAQDKGKIANIAVTIGQGTEQVGARLQDLSKKLQQLFGQAGNPFEQVIVQSDSRLRYADLMSVVEVCTKQEVPDPKDPTKKKKLSKLSFVVLPTDPK